MAADAEERAPEGEAVDEEEGLRHDHGVDEARQEFLGGHGVLFDELGEVVEAGCWQRERALAV